MAHFYRFACGSCGVVINVHGYEVENEIRTLVGTCKQCKALVKMDMASLAEKERPRGN